MIRFKSRHRQQRQYWIAIAIGVGINVVVGILTMRGGRLYKTIPKGQFTEPALARGPRVRSWLRITSFCSKQKPEPNPNDSGHSCLVTGFSCLCSSARSRCWLP